MSIDISVRKIPPAPLSTLVHRVAVPTDYAFALRQMNLDPAVVQSLLRGRPNNGIDLVRKMIDDVFTPRVPMPVGRYSNGFPAFYGGLEPDTSDSEVNYWVNKIWAGKPGAGQRIWYFRIEVNFLGRMKDLRPITPSHPELMADSDYTSCHIAGNEVKSQKVDALLAYSVRRPSGTCIAAFEHRTLTPIRLGKEIGWQQTPTGNYKVI